jgi:CRISPR-associated endonuclease/helicase Cas3
MCNKRNFMQLNSYAYWGKAVKPGDCAPQDISHHPALCHMLDVAAVAQALLENASDTLRRLLLEPLNCPEAQKIPWLCFIISLHDLGKISPGFQRKRDKLFTLLPELYPFSVDKKGDESDHGKVTYAALTALLREKGCDSDIAKPLANALGAHHGRFYRGVKLKKVSCGKAQWPQAREEIVEALREVFGLEWQAFPFGQDSPAPDFILALAGLTSLADWLGSDAEQFGYVGNFAGDLREYRAQRLKIAQKLVRDLHFHPLSLPPAIPLFQALFPFPPNACQHTVLEIAATLQAPALLLIETPMGSGKTEAALAVADRWLRQKQARGIYYALPTQATANQMFGQIKQFLQHYPQDNGIELHLLHAYAMLHEGYQELQAADVHGEDTEADIQASAWFSGAKRGLLSTFAVGTVDQALLAAVRAKHLFVRLFGLAGKVVIIDEVHAYDAYTSQILERLINWLARLDCSVILLSATLPAAKRTAFLKAYHPAASLKEPPGYPCILGVDRRGQVETSPFKILVKLLYNMENAASS